MKKSRTLELEITRLEDLIVALKSELKKKRNRMGDAARAEAIEIRDSWESLDTRWWIGVVTVLVALLLGSYLFYMNLGWYADQRELPPSSDWLLERLPRLNVIPMLSWGWLMLHGYALVSALLYSPRRMPFLFFLLSIYLCVRTLYVFLSPIGAPIRILDMREFDSLFAAVAGEYTFQNEFIFSGHTAVPFLFFLFFERRVERAIMLIGSLIMGACVLLTHNHYSVDVLSAYLVGYAIYALAGTLFTAFVRPLYLKPPSARHLHADAGVPVDSRSPSAGIP
jgi:membrane-associated phospholipid phosphatase